MTSAPCPSHPKARFEHFCGECGKPTSSFGRQMRQSEADLSKARRDLRQAATVHSISGIEGGDHVTVVRVSERVLIRISDQKIRRLLAYNSGPVIVDV